MVESAGNYALIWHSIHSRVLLQGVQRLTRHYKTHLFENAYQASVYNNRAHYVNKLSLLYT